MTTIRIAAAALCAFGLAAFSPSDWAAPQIAEMDAAGFGAPVEAMTFEGDLARGGTREIALSLTPGAWVFAGLCGEECESVVVDLHAPNGQSTGEHLTFVGAELTGGGAYKLKVSMERCGESRCRYVVRAYRRG